MKNFLIIFLLFVILSSAKAQNINITLNSDLSLNCKFEKVILKNFEYNFEPFTKNQIQRKDINKLIKLEKFAEAHKMLKSLKKVNTDEADRLNLLGFTARKSGDLAAAGDYYQQALALNPRHTGALEYQGELFIQLGKIELAKANLAKIDKICWLPCNAERELKKAIENSITN